MMVNNNTTIRRDEEERERKRKRDCAIAIWSMHFLPFSYFLSHSLSLSLFYMLRASYSYFFFQRKNDIGCLHRMQEKKQQCIKKKVAGTKRKMKTDPNNLKEMLLN